MIRPILQKPDPRLLERSQPVTMTTAMGTLIGDLMDTRMSRDGLSLSAVQIGTSLRVVALKPQLFYGFGIIINPEIVERSQATNEDLENCFSVDDGQSKFRVRRHNAIRVRFLDRKGQEHDLTSAGLSARAIQHEVDHLEGKLIA